MHTLILCSYLRIYWIKTIMGFIITVCQCKLLLHFRPQQIKPTLTELIQLKMEN